MNDLQKAEFEILKVFIEICNKLNLRYYLVCGSVLGAVKYSGFIPWDDDIDVALPRPDYDKFCEIAVEYLPQNIFLQNFHTDPEFPHIFSKLRNSNTTYIEKGTSHLNIHHGVFIDVFPLDGYPIGKRKQCVFEIKRKVLSWKQYCALYDKSKIKVRLRNVFFRMLGYHKRTSDTLTKMEELFKSYDVESSDLWCCFGNYQGRLEYASRDHYGNGLTIEFEGINVIIPENYEKYLTQKYGDWRAELPLHQQYGHHFYLVCDFSKSYKNYVDNPNKK